MNFTQQARIARFGSGATILRSPIALTDEQIMESAPSVFADLPHESRSERFAHIPTSEVLKGLRKEGFMPYEVRQGGSRDEAKRGFTKHLLRFRHETDKALTVGDSQRELILLNAHDGTSSYQLMSGVFRMVCSNGLVVSEGGIDLIRVAHKGDVVGRVIEGSYQIIENNKQVDSLINEMRQIELNPNEVKVFAESALELRRDEKHHIELAEVVRPRRREDTPNNLWTVFNRVQENMVNGGMHYTHTMPDGSISSRRTRPVQNIAGNVNLNRALWSLAAKMQELKAA